MHAWPAEEKEAQPNRDGYIRHTSGSKLNTGLCIQGNLYARG